MPNVIGMAFKNSIEIRKEKNVKERVNAINFASWRVCILVGLVKMRAFNI